MQSAEELQSNLQEYRGQKEQVTDGAAQCCALAFEAL